MKTPNTVSTVDRDYLLKLTRRLFKAHSDIINKTWNSSELDGDKFGDQNVGFNAIQGILTQWIYHINDDRVPDDGYTGEKIETIVRNLHMSGVSIKACSCWRCEK